MTERGLYKHYLRGGLYQVLGEETDHATGERRVVYVPKQGARAGQMEGRPLEDFHAKVFDHATGQQVKRFQLVYGQGF